MQKGQFIRLLLFTEVDGVKKVVAAAKQMQLHLSANVEESSTKDTDGNAMEYEVTGQSYDITGSALILSMDDSLGGNSAYTLADFENWLQDQILNWQICIMSGVNQRIVSEIICGGQCKLTQLQIQGQVKQTAQYSYTMNGYGGIKSPDMPSVQTLSLEDEDGGENDPQPEALHPGGEKPSIGDELTKGDGKIEDAAEEADGGQVPAEEAEDGGDATESEEEDEAENPEE